MSQNGKAFHRSSALHDSWNICRMQLDDLDSHIMDESCNTLRGCQGTWSQAMMLVMSEFAGR